MQRNSIFSFLSGSQIIALLTVTVFISSCSLQPLMKNNPQPSKPNQQQAGTEVNLKLNPAVFGNEIAGDFLGDSVEPYRMCEFVRLDQATPAMARMLINLGHGIIRFGGHSVEFTHWVPDSSASCDFTNSTITKKLLDSVFRVVKSLGRQATFSINLEHGNPATSAHEVAYAVSTAGSTLLGVEIGNEPDLYGWGYSQFKSTWQANYNAIRAVVPNQPIVGPSTCCDDSWFHRFMNENAPQLAIASGHNYPTNSQNNPSIDEFLSSSLMKSSADRIKSLSAAAHAKHLKFDLNETNAVADTPPEGIDGAFVMSLWGLDYAFTAAENGADTIEFHGTFPGDATSPFYSNGDSVSRCTLYHGMHTFQ